MLKLDTTETEEEEVHFDLRLRDRAADHACFHDQPVFNQVRQLRHTQTRNREVDEARLCGSSFPTGPTRKVLF